MKKLFAQVLISLLALGCMACTACTTTEKPPAPPPKPALPYKINLVWQHDHKPEVDLSTLDKVPGVNVVSPTWSPPAGTKSKTNMAKSKTKVWRATWNGPMPGATRCGR